MESYRGQEEFEEYILKEVKSFVGKNFTKANSRADILISLCRSFADLIVNWVISDFKASAEVTEVWPKLETFMGHSLTDLKSMAEVIIPNFRNFQNAISQSI
ncbi:unnamed protein product [Rhizophagus irregularis]|nr:unnamed protein product [Rhizophagus irregularis]CAB4401941.1 unnamed protein product [Rhizophagus irregularis]